ncbi:MAG: alpha/beta hydrolase [Planctomycetota bacterium]
MTSAKPLMLYLPGLDGTGRLLFAQPRLAEAFSLHCHGYPQTGSQTYRTLAEEAAQRIQRVRQPNQQSIVLCESFGGGVAIELAMAFPDCVDRLVLVNTFAHYPHRLLIRAGAMLSYLLPGRPSPPRSRKHRERFLFADDLPWETRQQWWQCVSDVPMSALGRRIRLISQLDRRDQLKGIQTPAFVVVSQNDRTVPPSSGELLAQRLPNAAMARIGGGHTAMSHPEVDMTGLITEWLDQTSR